MTALQASEYIIRRAVDNESQITNLKLQKTLYYLQGYSLRVFGKTFFEDIILHWQYGPVVPTAYFKYSINGSSALQMDDSATVPLISKAERKLFDKVIDKCLEIRTRDLVDKTHAETPWKKTKHNEIISNDMITKYFCANNPLDIELE